MTVGVPGCIAEPKFWSRIAMATAFSLSTAMGGGGAGNGSEVSIAAYWMRTGLDGSASGSVLGDRLGPALESRKACMSGSPSIQRRPVRSTPSIVPVQQQSTATRPLLTKAASVRLPLWVRDPGCGKSGATPLQAGALNPLAGVDLEEAQQRGSDSRKIGLVDDGVWFNGDAPVEGLLADFLDQVRARVTTHRLVDLSPSATTTWTFLKGQLIEATVPGLTCPRHTLRVLYNPSDPQAPLLEGELGDEHLFDAGPDDLSQLMIRGLEASAEQCARWAVDWLEAQLRRPVVRREWDRPPVALAPILPTVSGNIAAVEWWFTDADEGISYRESLIWWRLVKRPPDREIIERPDRRKPDTSESAPAEGQSQS